MFYNMAPSIADWYSSINRMHLNTYEKNVNENQVIADITENKVPKDYAIVLLCQDGRISLKLYSQLEKMSYTNVYVVDGGYQQIVTERGQL